MNAHACRLVARRSLFTLLTAAVAACGPGTDRQQDALDSIDVRLRRLEAHAAADSVARADSAGTTSEHPTAIVRAYFTALVARDFARAAALSETGGDSAAFARAHGDTTVTSFEVGEPGDVGAAAGSRYVIVPVVMRGTTPDRPPLLLHGRVTVRRSGVDGATDAQRRWRIYGIEWSSNAKPAQR
jgi:hypothetical protein